MTDGDHRGHRSRPDEAGGPSPDPDPTVRLSADEDAFAPGQVLADRYRIVRRLGHGGVGEVWQAHDLKLRVDVVLKALLPSSLERPRRLELLRREVRSARRVLSPHVCRIYDLVVIDGRELISMELVDGTTLLEVLRERGPLDLEETQNIATQFLSGLEAIHSAGLVHRDVKPENIMLTRSGRVLVMDFGLAREEIDRSKTVSGTPAYMAPEQLRGERIDARADLFAAGVVLAEMVSDAGVKDRESRQRLWNALREEPPRAPGNPWAGVIRRAVASDPRRRYPSARGLIRAIEDVALRNTGSEDATPYPGLASFTEGDSDYFFGREADIEHLVHRLDGPARLLAIVGPSGAGKTSFLRAGVIPAAGPGWGILRCTPGPSPLAAMRGALTPVLAEQTNELQALMENPDDLDVVARAFDRWRRRHEHALLIVDQFEELFTLNAPERQEQISELLGRLSLVADVHVILSLRDDFLMHCGQYPALEPVFSDLTPLAPLSGDGLRRALTQPATRCGYHFENDELVETMVAEVRGERGALPMLAFAAARLWERRDRQKGHLSWAAYEEIGGVGGALARHAETTLARIGAGRRETVRELFRNLVTAEGTRTVQAVDDLLSIFADQRQAKEVLDSLIEARLVTSFEEATESGAGGVARVEIIHESLLTHWPRLRRWRTQDAEGAQLRDELRQSARLWDQRGRSDDLLWTGTAYREFRLWHERYPGGLTDLEEDFVSAMTSMAHRRRRRRRVVVGTVVLLALVVAGVTSALWQRSERARQRAESEARHAEASELLALARARQEADPTEALAFAIASLELSDTKEARVFAVQLLWEAPPVFEFRTGGTMNFIPRFSPEGNYLAVSGNSDEVRVWSAQAPNTPTILSGHPTTPRGSNTSVWASGGLLVTGNSRVWNQLHVWRFPGGERVRTIDLVRPSLFTTTARALMTETPVAPDRRRRFRVRSWDLPDGESRELGRVDADEIGAAFGIPAPDGSGWVYARGPELRHRVLDGDGGRTDTLLGRHPARVSLLHPMGDRSARLASSDENGAIRIWDFSGASPRLTSAVPAPATDPRPRIPDPTGRWALAVLGQSGARSLVWDLTVWPQARPIELRRGASLYASVAEFHPSGDWVVMTTHTGRRLTFFPLRRERAVVVEGYTGYARPIAFSPDGRWLATTWSKDAVRLWPLPGNEASTTRRLALPRSSGWSALAFDPEGRYVFVVGNRGLAYVVPLDGSDPRRLEGFSEDTLLFAAAVSPSGRRVATAFGYGMGSKHLLVWDLQTDHVQKLALPGGSPTQTGYEGGIKTLTFDGESTIYSAGDGGVRRWDLDDGEQELVFATEAAHAAAMRMDLGHRVALLVQRPLGNAGRRDGRTVERLDLDTGERRALPQLGRPRLGRSIHLSAGIFATGALDGTIRTGRLDRSEPHLLGGHDGPVDFITVSPDGRWLASTGQDNTMRLWPMPDLSEPPPHTLPRGEFVSRLSALTNLRARRSSDSTQVWEIELAEFPGWQRVPRWKW